MTNHPNRSPRPIRSIARNAFPGDVVCIMQGPHRDENGDLWPHETEYTPVCYGADNVRGMHRQIVSIGGREIGFDRGKIGF